MNFIDRMKSWARSAPLSPGQMVDGEASKAFGLGEGGKTILLLIDSNGRVFQLHNAKVADALVTQVTNGRSAVVELMGKFDVQDGPAWGTIDL